MLIMLATTFSCSDETTDNTIDLSSIERVDPSVVAARIDVMINSGDFDKIAVKNLIEVKNNLFASNVSRGGNQEIICDNEEGWITIDNDTGDMLLTEYVPGMGTSTVPCSMACMDSHCFGQME